MNTEYLDVMLEAARDKARVSGLTHGFYRYPARFSPRFARAAIEAFTQPGELVLDPYMGGGTTIVEALASGRRALGNDLNALAVFVTRVKTTFLTEQEQGEVRGWAQFAVDAMSFRASRAGLAGVVDDPKAGNLTLPMARPVKKALAGALVSANALSSQRSRDFARCVLLRTGQWALDGRSRVPCLRSVRERVISYASEMLEALRGLEARCASLQGGAPECRLREGSAADIDTAAEIELCGKADLVVTSPPYPGVHVLYHRWQINGRRETPAPYWITGCNDGQGASHYNFGDRRGGGLEKYFRTSLETLASIRHVLKPGGRIVQLVAFSEPEKHLPLYLGNMRDAGFDEVLFAGQDGGRIWRDVPSRKWHATLKGATASSREVVLVHRVN